MEKIKTLFRVYCSKELISYSKMCEYFVPFIEKKGKMYQDLCEYKLTQIFDGMGQATEEFYYSNRSLEDKTTYITTNVKEFTSSYNLDFLRREGNHGIFKKNTPSAVVRYYGVNKVVVNSPYMIPLNFGDYVCIANGLLMVIPKEKFETLFKAS